MSRMTFPYDRLNDDLHDFPLKRENSSLIRTLGLNGPTESQCARVTTFEEFI